MIAILESITQNLAQEMESTGTITLNGSPFPKRFTTNTSPYAGLCGPAVAKLVDMVKEAIPESRINIIKFAALHPRQPLHIIAEITTEEGTYLVDPTVRQYVPDAKMVYLKGEQYPIAASDPPSIQMETIYNNL